MQSPNRQDQKVLFIGAGISLIFTLIIAWAGRFLDTSTFLPDAGASWYFWKLPNPTFLDPLHSLGFYPGPPNFFLGHYLHRSKEPEKIYTSHEQICLVGAGYQCLLQCTSSGTDSYLVRWTRTGCFNLVFSDFCNHHAGANSPHGNRRRGLFWGKKVPFSKAIIDLIRKYHGYYIAWAVVYTFWYHPMESSIGHLMGFFYMFFLMMQGSLLYTRVHVTPWWTTFLEFFVCIHGTIVAIMQQNGIWPMFFFWIFRHLRLDPATWPQVAQMDEVGYPCRLCGWCGCRLFNCRIFPFI